MSVGSRVGHRSILAGAVIEGDHATGQSYAIAHHLFTEHGERKLRVGSLRYLDTFAKIHGDWYFAERNLVPDQGETGPSSPGT